MANILEIIMRAKDETSAAFRAAQAGLQKMQGAVTALTTVSTYAITALAGYAATTIAGTKAALDYADATAKAAQRAGIALETFSALSFVGKLADVSQQDLITSTKKLSEELVKQGRSGADLTGELLKVADEFAGMADGAAKTARAVDLFGRSGQQLIPLLNQGSEAIRTQLKEAKALGVVIGDEFGRNAQTFNDNLSRMRELLRGVFLQAAEKVLPTLIAMSEAFLRWAQDSNFVQSAVDGVTTAIITMARATLAGVEAWKTFSGLIEGKTFEQIGNELEEMEQSLTDLENRLNTIKITKRPDAAATPFDPELLETFEQRHAEAVQKAMDLQADWQASLADGAAAQRARIDIEYQQRLAQIGQLALAEDESLALSFQAHALHEKRITELAKQENQKRAQLTRLYVDQASQFFSNLATTAKAFGKKGFDAWKAFSIAQAIIDTYKAANAAYAALAGIPVIGPALGAVAAGAAIAAGLANVAIISSTKPAGAFHGGADFVPQEASYLLQRGERVIQPEANRDLTEFLNAGGTNRGSYQINLHLDGRILGKAIGEMSRDGRMTISLNAIA